MEVVRKGYDQERPIRRPLAVEDLTEDELAELLDQAMEECRNGEYLTLEEFAKAFGIEE